MKLGLAAIPFSVALPFAHQLPIVPGTFLTGFGFGFTVGVAEPFWRIQAACNQLGRSLLISDDVMRLLSLGPEYEVENLGVVPLRGKAEGIELCAVDLARIGTRRGVQVVPHTAVETGSRDGAPPE